MRQVLVTGGAGFIGSHLVRALIERGDRVRVLDNLVAGKAENMSAALNIPPAVVRAAFAPDSGRLVPVAERCEVARGDIRDPAIVGEASRGVEVIFHQAALRSVPRSLLDPVATADVNVMGTQVVLEAARRAGVRRVVFASSSSVYGDTPLPKSEHQVPQPKSPYAASKLAGEALCQAYSRAFGLSTVLLRYFNVFGPHQDPASDYATVIPKFLGLAVRDQALPVHGDGSQSRDFTYVDNVVSANLSAAVADVDSVPINIGGGSRHTLRDLIEEIGRMLGRTPSCTYEPPREGDVQHTHADISLAQKLLGYEPRVDFRAGLRSTYQAMRQQEMVALI